MKSVKSSSPRIALLFDCSIYSCRQMLNGVLRYQKAHGPWIMDIIANDTHGSAPIRSGKYDGAIVDYTWARREEIVKSAAVPLILWDDPLASRKFPKSMPWHGFVNVDNFAIANTAADYFVQRNFRSFAYIYTARRARWSDERFQAFNNRLARHGLLCRIFQGSARAAKSGGGGLFDADKLAVFLKSLPRKTAVFAADDEHARQTLDLCLKLGIDVPNDLAVLGVDNYTKICETANPPLSSIAIAWEETGYLAAQALDQAITQLRDGLTTVDVPSVIPFSATGVITRESTNEQLSGDPVVRRAMSIITAANGVNISAHDVCERLHISRRALELHFASALRASPYEIIQRTRLDHIQSLARDSSLTISEIASLSGFSAVSNLCTFFHRRTNQTLATYRQNYIATSSLDS